MHAGRLLRIASPSNHKPIVPIDVPLSRRAPVTSIGVLVQTLHGHRALSWLAIAPSREKHRRAETPSTQANRLTTLDYGTLRTLPMSGPERSHTTLFRCK